MAKDKEKLFKGIDDKAITFQRAVFIVCNLKRLIKRPKKDEKHSGTRKRSNEPRGVGSGGTDDDELRAGYAAARRATRMRDPVRRAFTLPTMLCNSFAMAASTTTTQPPPPPLLPHQLPQLTLDQSIVANTNQQQQQPVINLPEFVCHAHQRSSSSSPATAAAQQQRETYADEEDWIDVATASCSQSIRAALPATLYPNFRVSGFPEVEPTCRQCKAQEVANNLGGSTKLGVNLNTHCYSNNVSSLSCLITPVRRVTTAQNNNNNNAATTNGNQNSPPPPTLLGQRAGSQLALSERRDCVSTDGRKWSPLSPLGHLHSEQQQASSLQVTTTGQQVRRSACCPIWLHLMGQLDARQGQSREQFSQQFAHLLGAPSSLPYLLAPTPVPLSSAADICSGQVSSVQMQSVESEAHSPEQQQRLSQRRRRRSSNESVEQRRRRCRRQRKRCQLLTGAGAAGRQEQVVGGASDGDDGIRLASQSTTTTNTSYSSADSGDASEEAAALDSSCVGINEKSKSSTQSSRHITQQEEQQSSSSSKSNSSEQVRMKRFGSAICLASDHQNQSDNPTTTHSESRNNNNNQQQQQIKQQQLLLQQNLRKQKEQQQVPSGEMRTCAQVQQHSRAQLTAQDPILLARQRRPSASNQGSLNVDQQALFSAVECNQLERAKSILKEAKVNVNSLNGEKLTCLDIAVLMRNVEMVQLLQQHNAKESSAYLTREGRANQLYSLYTEARRLVEDLSRSLEAISPGVSAGVSSCSPGTVTCAPATTTNSSSSSSIVAAAASVVNPTSQTPSFATATSAASTVPLSSSSSATVAPALPSDDTTTKQTSSTGNVSGGQSSPGPLMLATGSLLSSALFEEKQRQLQYWRRRLDLFMHMRYEFERLQTPSPPELIVLQVVGENSLGVKIVHSLRSATSVSTTIHHHHHHQFDPMTMMADSAACEAEHYQHLKGDQNSHHQVTLLNQQPMRIPSNLIGSCTDAKCSHWLLSEFGGLEKKLSSMHISSSRSPLDLTTITADNSGTTTIPADDQQSGDRMAAIRQQQRLAVFNQLLAQQLTMLCHQQRHVEATCRWSPGRLPASEQLDSERRAYRQTRPFASFKNAAQHTCNSPDECAGLAAHCTASIVTATAPDINLQGGLNAQATLEQYAPGSIAYRLLAGGRAAGERTNRTQRHLLANQPKELSLCGSSTHEFDHHHHQQQQYLNFPHLTGNFGANLGIGGIGGGGGETMPMIITKYKLEWSLNEQMNPVLNSMIVYNTNSYPLECQINGLTSNQAYYVRVSAGNHRGFSEAKPTTPVCLIPSSWRQVEGNKRRKYDEEVFRKFTKLILLNKHILDDHQLASAAATAAATTSAGGMSNANTASGAGFPLSSSCALNELANKSSANKSSLINMLLLDATTPSANKLRQEDQFSVEVQKVVATARGALYPLGSQERDSGIALSGSSQMSNSGGVGSGANQQQQQQQPSSSVRKNLKNFFQSNTFKFHKLNNQNKRGLYLTTVIYHSPVSGNSSTNDAASTTADQNKRSTANQTDKIVVTNDDRLPIIEVINDLVSPGALMSDFYWLLKINGTQWMDIKRLRQQLQKSHSSSTLHLRIKLLSAIEQMQLALNMEDIGRLFYKPIQAHDGSMVICTCKQVASTKLVSNLSIKWTQQHKLIPRHLIKISESVQNNQQQQNQQVRDTLQQVTVSRKERNNSSTVDSLPSHSGSGTTHLLTSGVAVRLRGSDSSALPLQPLRTANESLLTTMTNRATLGQRSGADFRLCEHCQFALIQRRCTMASGSSNSSLASSSTNESQVSCSGVNQQISSRQSLSRCTCAGARLSGSTLGSQQHLGGGGGGSAIGGNLLLNTTTSSSSGSGQIRGISKSASGTRSGSMISTTGSGGVGCGGSATCGANTPTPTHHGSLSARQSQAVQHLSSAHKSSTYLMLASLSLYDLLLYTLSEIVLFDRQSTVPLTRGLYLGFVQLQTTVESMRLLVPRARPNMVPCARIRDNSHVSREEWQLLKQFGTLGGDRNVTASSLFRRTASRNPDASTRISDPSLWSADSGSAADADTPTRVDEPAPKSGLTPAGFERDRAKSVSPGMLRTSSGSNASNDTQAGVVLQVRDALSSVSNERLCSVDTQLDHQQLVSSNCAMKINQNTLDDVVQQQQPDKSQDNTCPPNEQHRPRQPSDTSGCSRASTSKRRESAGTTGGSSPNTCSTRLPCRSPTTSSRLTAYSTCSLTQQAPEETFVRLVGSAAQRLLAELKSQLPKVYQPPTTTTTTTINNNLVDDQENSSSTYVGNSKYTNEVSILQALNDDENNRIYHLELIELSSQVSFVLLIPSAENVCPVTSHEKSNILADNKEYMLLPLQIFEIIHISTYEPDLLGKYSRLSAILETDLIVAQHDHRQAFSSNELKSTKTRVSHLQDMVSIADEFWRQLRWIVDVVSFARDKSSLAANGGIKLGSIWRYFELSRSVSYEHSINLLTNNSTNYNNKAAVNSSQQVAFKSHIGSGEQVASGVGGQRSGYEVKRTTSARGTREHSVRVAADNNNSSGNRRQQCKDATGSSGSYADGSSQVNAPLSGRRHSGDATMRVTVVAPQTTTTTTTSKPQRQPYDCRQVRCTIFADDQIRVQEIRDDINTNEGRDSTLVQRQLATAVANKLAGDNQSRHLPTVSGNTDFRRLPCEPSEDEEAIYAYHITLRDATRAAAQRKSSQQSIRAFVGDDEPVSPCSAAVWSTTTTTTMATPTAATKLPSPETEFNCASEETGMNSEGSSKSSSSSSSTAGKKVLAAFGEAAVPLRASAQSTSMANVYLRDNEASTSRRRDGEFEQRPKVVIVDGNISATNYDDQPAAADDDYVSSKPTSSRDSALAALATPRRRYRKTNPFLDSFDDSDGKDDDKRIR